MQGGKEMYEVQRKFLNKGNISAEKVQESLNIGKFLCKIIVSGMYVQWDLTCIYEF